MYSGDEYYGDDITSPLERPLMRRKARPFRALRDLVYTECPCGCGLKGDICEARRTKVKEADDRIPF